MTEQGHHRLGCRFCAGELPGQPLLAFHNSPASAQGFLSSIDEPVQDVDLLIYQCRFCGLVQHALPAVPYHKDAIRAVAFSEQMRSFRLGQLQDWLEKTGLKHRRILEIGCGKGEYLTLMRAAGATQVSGLEHGRQAVEHARAEGLDVRQGYLDATFQSPWPTPFEGFAIFSFMEHWPDLTGSLRRLHGLLSQGACGLVEVPNFQFVLQSKLYSEFTPDHIFYFEPATFAMVLEMNGFAVERMDSVWHDYILSAQVTKKKPLDVSGLARQQAAVVAEVRAFVDRFHPHEVVVWGAGHQALAVMSMAQLGTSISHVIDSASFKQGKYTPGSRLLIKPPHSLAQDAPKAMLIMAAAYSDEVLDVVLRDHPEVQHIAILREHGLEVVNRD